MTIRLSIFSRILLWLFLNLVILAVIFLLFFQIKFHVPPDSMLAGSTSHNTVSLYRMIRHDLNTTPRYKWDALLERYACGFDAHLTLVSLKGRRLAGMDMRIPDEVADKMHAWRKQFRCTEKGRGYGPHHGFRRVLRVRTTDPVRYWLGIPLPLVDIRHGNAQPAMLLISTESLTGSGLFPDIMPVLTGALIIIIISVLWWLPMVRQITRPLKLMTKATAEIADGRFDVRLDDRRMDEIGRLSRSINIMSERLENFITGRKRFLSDVAHELCSPLARLKMALGILENRLGSERPDYLQDVAEEADNIAELVNEILAFSRAELSECKTEITCVDVAESIRKVLEREKNIQAEIVTDVQPGITAMCNADLLVRALANLVRNAARYAGNGGPVKITAHNRGEDTVIEVIDSGPGIPRAYLNRIFDPFFRLEIDRSRDSGGAGLGLAIVKTCIETCGGKIRAENRNEGGFKITIKFPGC